MSSRGVKTQNMIRFCRYGFAFLCVSAGCIYGAYSPNLPVGSRLDRLMTRLSTIYGITPPHRFYLQPYSLDDAERYFELLDSSACGSLSATEKALLEKARRRYGEKGLITWARPENDIRLKINLDLLGDARPSYHDSAALGVSGIAHPSLCGNVGKVSFYSGISVWTEYRSDTLFPESSYEPYNGLAYNLYGRAKEASLRSSDVPFGGIRYDAGRIELETAVDYLRCGPAQFFPLTLSGNAPPITYLRGVFDLDVIYYQHIVGQLKVDKRERKYIFMHRLGSDLWNRRIHLGINEVIIYGNTTSEPRSVNDSIYDWYRQNDRGLEWIYCIPMVPFKFVEHYAGDRDNAAISFDLTLLWPRGWRWYGEFFIDDMLAPWKVFSPDWGNKWALTAGVNYFGKLRDRDLTIQAEYSRVEPWVYTHFCGGSHRYSHFNACLGSPMGPNSQAAIISTHLQVHRLHEVGIGLQHAAYNHTVRGGKITDIFQPLDPGDTTQFHDNATKRFLGPGTEWYLQPVLYWNFNLFGRFALHSSLGVDLLDKRGRGSFAIDGGLYF